jgi:hypothetical protein
MEQVELEGLEWYAKVNELLTLGLANVRNGVYPSDSQMEAFEALHGVYHNGELPLYKNKTTTKHDILSQGLLFNSADKAVDSSGTKVDNKG